MILSSAALLATLAGGQIEASQEMRLMRFPAVHGENVVFTYASDLWVAKQDGGLARRLTSHPNSEIRPRVSPDGRLLAFTASYDGNNDVYVMPIEGGEPKRLTFEQDADNVVGWTPDGRIAYTSTAGSNFGGLPRLWLISPKGGLPEGTPILEAQDVSFSPDGKKVAYHRMNSQNFNWRQYRGGTQGRISIYDLEKNTYTELPSKRENSYSPMWIGDRIYFVSDRDLQAINLFVYDLDSKRVRRLTNFDDADIKWPSTDGKTIVFERDGNLYSFDVATEKLVRLNPRVLSDNVAARPALRELANQVTSLTVSPSGVRVAVEARGEVFSVPVKTGDTRNLTQTSGARERFPRWSPDGKWIAYVSDRTGEVEVYIEPQRGGEAVQLTDRQGAGITSLEWSPDSKKLAFTTNSNELKVVDVDTKRLTVAAVGRISGIGSYDWSPDSKWLAFVDASPNLQGTVFLHELATGKNHQATEGYFHDTAVAFDQSGKYLYFVSARTVDPSTTGNELALGPEAYRQQIFMIVLAAEGSNPLLAPGDEEPEQPAPSPGGGAPGAQAAPGPQGPPGPRPAPTVKIDLQGIASRIVPLTVPPGFYGALEGVNEGVLYLASGTLSRYDVKSRESTPILSGAIQAAAVNATRTKIAYYGGGTLGVIDIRPGQRFGDGAVSLADVEAVISPREEWNQIFWDAWRHQRDNYYDPNFRGLNWRAVGERYSRYLPYVAHRSDLSYVLGLMYGELGTSHAYVTGGDPWIAGQPVPTGHLGADYEAANGKVRFARIYRGVADEQGGRGPLAEPGVNVKAGDYLLEIDGVPLDAGTNPHSLLVNKVGRFVTLTVNDKPSMDGARRVRVRPIAGETGLRYTEWVEDNRRYVNQKTNGRVGYMHVPNTSFQGAIGFVRGYAPNADKEALIVDERFNGGGFIPTFFVERLARTTVTYYRQRTGGDLGFPVQTVDGPKVMLINAYAGSGGDHLPWLFKTQGLGKLVGTRTWGGLVGIFGFYPLVDGGGVSSPEFGLYDPKTGKWIAENEGIEPDIEVDARPDLIARGIDPQLDKAIEVVMEELRRQGPRKLRRPDYVPIRRP